MKLKNMFTKLLAAVVAVTLTLQPVAFQTAAYVAALLNHYLTVGILEGRTAYAGQDPQEIPV